MKLPCGNWLWIQTLLAATLVAGYFSPAWAQISFTEKPAAGHFAKTTVGLFSHNINFYVTNTGSSNFTVENVTINPSEFQLINGWTPYVVQPGHDVRYALNFVPDAAQLFNGQLTINIAGVAPIVIPLNGTGASTAAVPSLNVSSLNFSNDPVGAASIQTVTVTNTGTSTLNVEAVMVEPPFAVTGFTPPVELEPKASLPLQVSFIPSMTGTFTDNMVVEYDVVPATGIDLSGTAVRATALAVTSFPTLPAATQAASYLATLTAAGGTGTLTFTLNSQSALPSGLALAASGAITGTVASSVATGNYSFGVNVKDDRGDRATAQFTLPVLAPTGATCNNITWNIPGSTAPMVPLTDLGTGTFLGSEGGLYPDGSNIDPAAHEAAGLAMAQSIQPLDAAGNPDPNGQYAMISIGMSAASATYDQFIIDANADPLKSPYLVTARGAQPDAGAVQYADIRDGVWNTILQFYLPQAGVTPNQVVAAWILQVDGFPSGKFPTDMSALQSQYESIMQNLYTLFPNIKLAYFTSKFYDGYANGTHAPSDPEPYAYESSFAVKWAIQDQINGSPNLNYDPTLGPVMAPWMAWGPYDWANGLSARSDGLVWDCQELTSDGIHPSNPVGREKESNILLNFFKSDETAVPWFVTK